MVKPYTRTHTLLAPLSAVRMGAFMPDREDGPGREKNHSKGFTLVEMVVAVAIFGILVAVGVPSLRDISVNQRVKTATFDLYSSLVFARGEAIKRNANVDITPAGGVWTNGWNVRVQADATLLKTQGALSNMTFTGPAAAITYRRDGRLASGAATLTVAGGSNVTMRCIAIALDGRPNIALDHNSNGNCTDG
ncbi:MAG: GspH/FimT family pseudopilin [Gammaproteobacteria bacterium]